MDINKKLDIIKGIAVIVGSLGTYLKLLKPMWLKRKARQQEQTERENSHNQKLDLILFNQADANNRLDKLTEEVGDIKDSVAKQAERQKMQLNHMNIAFYDSDQNGDIVYVSPAMVRMVNHSESELMGKGWLSCIVPEDSEKVIEEWHLCLTDKRAFDVRFAFKKMPKGQKVHCLTFHMHNKSDKRYLGARGHLTLLELDK